MTKRRFGDTIMTTGVSVALLILLGLSGLISGDSGFSQKMDVLEGENVLLECRFDPEIVDQSPRFFWIRTNRDGHDNVAIGSSPLENNYSIEYDPAAGRYDLRIMNATYNRDNGQYECRMKQERSGQHLHSKSVVLTVLLQPSRPQITPEDIPVTATEGRPLNLTCSSVGGSPPPQIYWYREGQAQLLDAILIKGENKDEPTRSILTVIPSKENDGTVYRCSVWNRALDQKQKFETQTTLSVNYFPRIQIGPANPLRVERGDTARMECLVDAKPAVTSVRWTRKGRFIDTTFTHIIPQVDLEHHGTYSCSADNGLGQAGSGELLLDVLHGPVVSLPAMQKEVSIGESLEIECQVKANPRPTKIEWIKQDDPTFVQVGSTLRLTRMKAHDQGVYICSATNFLQPSSLPDGQKIARIGNASMEVLVRHPPGQTFISPDQPVAVNGKSVTLTCGAIPPGHPEPKFAWWKENGDILSVNKRLTLESVTLETAGTYHCQPTNELGKGSVATTFLDVHQAPEIITGLESRMTKREGDTGFQLTCSAMGKPKPEVSWYKDGERISISESSSFQIKTSTHEPRFDDVGFNVVSTLSFLGPDRITGQNIMPSDKGTYSCEFSNTVSSSESLMKLKVEHSPVVVHRNNKVAYDLAETAYIRCRMQAYPEPRFEWSFANRMIIENDDGIRMMNHTFLGSDIYESIVVIDKVMADQYGEFTCKAINPIGQKKTLIRLQPKGKPDQPENVHPVKADSNSIILTWDEGFNGGYNNTVFTIQYQVHDGRSPPQYNECQQSNPCKITGLHQHTQYSVKVKAGNLRGESPYSSEASVTTKVDVAMIPKPQNVHYEKSTGKASFLIDEYSFPLPLMAKIELENKDGTWSHYNGLKMNDKEFAELSVRKPVHNLRVRLCLETNELMCGPYSEATIVDVRPNAAFGPPRAGAMSTAPWLIAIVVVVILLAITALAIAVRCFCCQTKAKSLKSDTDSSRPSIVHQPPPYAFENKATVNSDKDLSDDNLKANLYGHYNAAAAASQHHHIHMSDPSTSNSGNGGSVNSQDSLWNVKNNGPDNGYIGYDPLAPIHLQQQQQLSAGYPPAEEYYPYSDEYLQQQYHHNHHHHQHLQPGDPYTMTTNRLHSDYAHYGDFSSLPDPYTTASSLLNGEHPQQNVQQSQQQQNNMQRNGNPNIPMFEDSVGESGYSTPTGKKTRIIREIIV